MDPIPQTRREGIQPAGQRRISIALTDDNAIEYMKYYIIAGEASGDLHGSNLMKGLYAEDPEADIRFWGGALMNAVFKANRKGEGLVKDYAEGAVIGFSQIILHAGAFLRRFRECQDDIVAFNPDVVILIDYPGFNFRVAEFAHKKGYKVFYYIAPKVWASRESRVKKLKAFVDKLFVVFPFEKEYFDRKGVEYVYLGNPLVDAIDNSLSAGESREEFMHGAGLEDGPYIAILAGSRKGEVSSMMPVCAAFADMLRKRDAYRNFRFIVAGAPSRSDEDYAPYLKGREGYMKVVYGRTHSVIRHAEAAVVNSGTASLETCLTGTPQVVAYSSSPFNFNIARHIIKIDMISLGNLILGRKAFKELIQYHFTPENLESEVRRLVEDGEYRERMLGDYAEIRSLLGGSGASAKVAKAMIQELEEQ